MSDDYARGLCDAAAMLNADRQTIRLHAGEHSAQEMRAVLAVLGWKRRGAPPARIAEPAPHR